MNKLLLAALAAATAAPLSAASPPAASSGKQVSIPFLRLGGITDFRAQGEELVFLRDRGGRWYRADLVSKCYSLPFARRIGLDSRGGGSVDRFTSLIVDGERCRIGSLTRSEKPQRRSKADRRS
jgi:hypothetical protein